MYKNNIPKLYLYSFFHSFIFAYVIERLFWASKGITVMQVVWIEIIYATIIMILELPMGMIADRFSRKKLIVADAILSLVEFFIITIATTFGHFAIAIAFSALGHTLQSGAHNALVYDTLKEDKKTTAFEKVLGRIRGIDYFGTMTSGLIGGLVAAKYNLLTTYWLSMISLLLALLLALSLKEVKQEQATAEAFNKEDWKSVFEFITKHKSIKRIMGIVLITAATVNYVFEFWQLYVEAVSISLEYFGIIQLISFGGVALTSAYAYKIKDKFGLSVTFNVALLISGAFLGVMAMTNHWSGIIAMFVVYIATAVFEPLGYAYLHEVAIDEYRATIESAFSMMENIVVMVVGVSFGYLATKVNIFIAFGYLSVLLLILSLYVLFVNRYKVA